MRNGSNGHAAVLQRGSANDCFSALSGSARTGRRTMPVRSSLDYHNYLPVSGIGADPFVL